MYLTKEEIAFKYETNINLEEREQKKEGHKDKEDKDEKGKEKADQPDNIIYAVHLFVRSMNICVYYYLMPLSLVLLNILYAFNYSHLSYVAPE